MNHAANVIVQELEKVGGLLHYNEKQLLKAGKISACFDSLTPRLQRWNKWMLFACMGTWCVPVVLLFASYLFHSETEQSGFANPFALFTWITVMNIVTWIGFQSRCRHIETLALLWRTLAAEDEPQAEPAELTGAV